MRKQIQFFLLLIAALFLVLSCQLADIFASQPTPPPPVAVSTLPVPTIVPPTLASSASSISSSVASLTSSVAFSSSSVAALPPGCTNSNATITTLADNGTVSGLIEIKGTATRPDMQYWKVEYRSQNSTAYDVLSRNEKGVTDDVLGRLSTKTLPNGVYFIRLVIVLKDGNIATPCEFRVTVQN